MKKRVLSILLCICMALTLLPTAALAAPPDDALTKLDISKGAITITADTASGYDSTGTEVNANDPDGYIIVGTGGGADNYSTLLTITGQPEGSTIQLGTATELLSITSNGDAPIKLGGATVQVAGSVSVSNGSAKPAISVTSDAAIDIAANAALTANSVNAYCIESEIGTLTITGSGNLTANSTGSALLSGSVDASAFQGNIELYTASTGAPVLGGSSIKLAGKSVKIAKNAAGDALNCGLFSGDYTGTSLNITSGSALSISSTMTSPLIYDRGSTNQASDYTLTSINGDVTLNSAGQIAAGGALTITAAGKIDITSGSTDAYAIITKSVSMKAGTSIRVMQENCPNTVIFAENPVSLLAPDVTVMGKDGTDQALVSPSLTVSENAAVMLYGTRPYGITTVNTTSATVTCYGNGGNVTATGLDLSVDTPTVETTYKAGNGTIVWTPATNDTPAQLKLTDATITSNGTALLLPNIPVALTVVGENELNAGANSTGIFCSLNDANNAQLDLTITGEAGSKLTVSGLDSAITNTKSVTLTGGVEVEAKSTGSGRTSLGVFAYNKIELQDTAKLTTKGDWAGVQVGETPTVAPGATLIGTATVSTAPPASHVTVYGDQKPCGVMETGLASFTIPKGSKLTVEDGKTLTLGLCVASQYVTATAVNVQGSFVNNGTILLPEGTTVAQIKALHLSGSGVVKIGENTYGNNGEIAHIATTALDFSSATGDAGSLDTDGYHWDAATATLTLKNFHLTASAAAPAGAITLPAQSNLVLEGDNTVVNTGGGDGIQGASSQTGTMTISGSGSLHVSAILGGIKTYDGDLQINSGTICATSSGDMAIRGQTVTISGGTVLATGGVYGIANANRAKNITISGGTVTAIGKTGNGLNAMNELHIAGGTVNAKGGKTAAWASSDILLNGVRIATPAGAVVGNSVNDAPGKAILVNGADALEVTFEKVTDTTGSGSTGTGATKGDTVTASGTDGAVSDSAVSSAITNAGKGGAVSIEAPNSTSTTLTGTAAAAVASNGSALNITLQNGGEIKVAPAVLKALNLKDTDKVSVGITAAAGSTDKAPSFEVNLAVNSTSIHELGGSMSIDLPVKAAWNGLAAIVEHLHVNGSKTYEKVSIANGKAPVTVTDLSTFTVRLASDVPAAAFTDLKAEDWSFGGIAYAVEQGLFAGTSASTFAPNSPMTRQQMWMVLARLSGQTPASMGAAKDWAVSNGISDGSKPTAAVTRQQMVTVLYRYSQKFCSLADEDSGSMGLAGYTDSDSIAAYAYDAMHWAVRSGIVQGNGDKLNPAGNTTRAQFAVILSRYDQSGK
ncbi:MAG: S-layer homology domain-containing protein [Oscillibacter sp.]|jgi:hypothetical protein|nr:S-layer homology domain-containing protein [Oscillibacter sp.]